jgi:hypothetical protein
MSLFGNNANFIRAILIPPSCLCRGIGKLKHPDRLYITPLYHFNWRKELTSTVIQINENSFYMLIHILSIIKIVIFKSFETNN